MVKISNLPDGGDQESGDVLPGVRGGTTRKVSGPLVKSDLAANGGTVHQEYSVSVSDDAVGEVTPPRDGGFATITSFTGSSFPDQSASGIVFFDTGNSLAIEKLTFDGTTSNDIETTTSDVSGTTGTDGKLTVSVQDGVLKFENRIGNDLDVVVTFN